MKKAKILCDASHNEDLKLGGFSGGYQIEDEENSWSEMYHGLTPDVGNSNIAEMMAIAGGAKKILDKLEQDGASVDVVDVYTDSYTAMDQYTLYANGRQHDPKYERPLALMDKYLGQFNNAHLEFHKVKSHVPAKEATPLEAFHNIVDKNALTVRWTAQNHLFKPKLNESRYYGIALPAIAFEEQSDDLMQLGYAYAKQGMFARVSFLGKLEDAKDNPFVKGIDMVAKERGVDISTLMHIEVPNKKGGRRSGCEGLDRTLIRHHCRQLGKWSDKVNFDAMPMMFSGVASRVMFGPQSLDLLNDSMLTGRKEQASKFVINVHSRKNMNKERPVYTNEWLNTFADYVDMPLHRGLKAAMDNLVLTPETTLSLPGKELRNKIKNMLDNYSGLEPSQLMGKVLEISADEGVTFDRNQRNSLVSLIERNGKNTTKIAMEISKGILNTLSGNVVSFGGGNKKESQPEVINKYTNEEGVEFHEDVTFVAHDTPPPKLKGQNNSHGERRFRRRR